MIEPIATRAIPIIGFTAHCGFVISLRAPKILRSRSHFNARGSSSKGLDGSYLLSLSNAQLMTEKCQPLLQRISAKPFQQ